MRVGIDVGGTFTHAVALDGGRVAAHSQVPTTHRGTEGVAAGILEALGLLLGRGGISPAAIRLVAFSTTQATNALLEGDTEIVGILGLGAGLTAPLASEQTRLGEMKLAPGLFLRTRHRFVATDEGLANGAIERAAAELQAEGASTVVVSAAFAVDDPRLEEEAAARVTAAGLRSMAASTLSGLYGLRQRTRTAVLNASILSVILRTAGWIEQSVRALGIAAPIQVMRSDGGVMGLEEMRRRPIQTILSGPAAGVAAALLHARVSDGIFLEVGGTSTDISVIRDGRARVSGARVGGHPVSVRALDITTLGIGGGSVPAIASGALASVGPRSAHIAGYRYACFASAEELAGGKPAAGDGALRIEFADGRQAITVTPTCAANVLGDYGSEDWGRGDARGVEAALAASGFDPREAARRIQELAAAKVASVLEELIADHELDRETIALVGGGGGAGAIVPAVARAMGLPHRMVGHAPVISAVGTALAMLRETIERSVPQPTERELLAIRREAWEKLAAMGAQPDTIAVEVEVETSRSLLRATASGTTGTEASGGSVATDEEIAALAARAFPAGCGAAARVASTGALAVFEASHDRPAWFGLSRRRERLLRVLDLRGVVRLQKRDASWLARPRGGLPGELAAFLAAHATYGDSGREAPAVQLLAGSRILDLSGVAREEQIAALIAAELAGVEDGETVVVVATGR